MNLKEAIKEFESNRTKRYTPAEVTKIHEVADELSLSEFTVLRDRFTDVDGIVSIHRTMIVCRQPFSESFDRGPHPYPSYPYFYALSEFTDKTNGQRVKNDVLEVFCNSRFIWVPVGRECECGDFHDEE